MSGLNPFRPKKPEDHQSYDPSRSRSSPSSAPDPIFLCSSSTAATAAPRQDIPSMAGRCGASTTPPPPIDAPHLDDPATPDDQSTSDPFDRDSDASEDEGERPRTTPEAPRIASPSDLRQTQTIPFTPPSDSSLNQPQTVTTPSDGQPVRKSNQGSNYRHERLRDGTPVATSLVRSQPSTSSEDTDSESTADEPQTPTHIKTSRRPISLGPDGDIRALTTRLANRDRIPPPPPKSHHGKLISSIPPTSPHPPQTTPSKIANRVSFHASSPGPLNPPRALQGDFDYFGAASATSQTLSPADVPRRTQSQNKRPPTPPLSRRHSQMRRSKSTLTKPTGSRLSTPLAEVEVATSMPSSPGSRSSNPGPDPSFGDEANSTLMLHSENVAPASSELPMETESSIRPNVRTTSKRASLVNQLPPPPPPRRTRGSNHGNHSNYGNDSNLPAGLHSEQRTDGIENFVPHPSNAKDILADLTRLQKEVDDLRGHYANQKAS